MDRALPLLKPGKSFQFAIVEGGKDPDEVLREQGPAALKAQLANSTPFAQASQRNPWIAPRGESCGVINWTAPSYIPPATGWASKSTSRHGWAKKTKSRCKREWPSR